MAASLNAPLRRDARRLALACALALSYVGCSDESSSSTDGAGAQGAGTNAGGTGATASTGGGGAGGSGAASAGGSGAAGAAGGSGGGGASSGGAGGSPPSGPGAEIVAALNAHRADFGKAPIPYSPSLSEVAEAHVHDLFDNAPHSSPGCNLHSWSDQGPWSACCYTADHAQAECMWQKPQELTVYPGYGYENAASGASSPQGAVDLWKGSPGHNAVMLNEGTWANLTWNAAGAALYNGYAVLWFGQEVDPQN